MKKNYFFSIIGLCLLASTGLKAQQVATFEDLSLEPESFWNGSDGSGYFSNGPAIFRNNYDLNWDSWIGFSYSNITDNTTAGYENQYSAVTGSGFQGSSNYAVGYVYVSDTIDLVTESELSGVYVTNSTYSALSMRDGNSFSKKFGGVDGTDADWFKLTVEGWDKNWSKTGSTEIYLADYRFNDSSSDYILNHWKWLDLLKLGTVSHLTFSLSSSDNGAFGMNTPAYFCLDNLTVVPHPETINFDELNLADQSYWNGSDGSGGFGLRNVFFPNQYDATYDYWNGWSYSNLTDTTTPGWVNQYSAITGSGVDGNKSYAVSYHYLANSIEMKVPVKVYGTYITNSTYAALSMRNGDAYSKKFGGADGSDPDFFLLTITGRDVNGNQSGQVDFYLADYQFTESAKDYIVDDWIWVDLSSLGVVQSLEFNLSSSDEGDFGMNTPGYFCLAGLTYEGLTEKQVQFQVVSGEQQVEGVTVAFNGEELSTGLDGTVVFSSVSPTSALPFEVSGRGFATYRDTIDVYEDMPVQVNLEKVPVDVKFVIDDGTNLLSGVDVNFVGTTLTTDLDGQVIFTAVSPTTSMDYQLTKDGYQSVSGTVNAFKTELVQITLLPDAIKGEKNKICTVYPNPVQYQFTVSSQEEITGIEIFSIMGTQIYQYSNLEQTSISINTSDWNPGIYVVRIKSLNMNEIYQIVKE